MQSLSRSSILEAVLFAAGAPLPLSKLAEIIEVPEWEVQEALTVLERDIAAQGRGIFLRRSAGGYQLVTHPSAFPWVQKLAEKYSRHCPRLRWKPFPLLPIGSPSPSRR